MPLCEEPQAAAEKGKETQERVKNQGTGTDEHIKSKAQMTVSEEE